MGSGSESLELVAELSVAPPHEMERFGRHLPLKEAAVAQVDQIIVAVPAIARSRGPVHRPRRPAE